MRLRIIGATGSGKSTLAQRLKEKKGFPVIEAGRYCRDACPIGATYDVMAEKSGAMLQRDHRCFSRLIKADIEYYNGNVIIVGTRNPVDFVDSFDPHNDWLISLDAGIAAMPGFEAKGITAIKAIVDFFLAIGIVDSSRVLNLVAEKDKEDWYASASIRV